MAVFRIEETRDYTVMANHHLRNTALSLKAKGLLSLMLSLPEDWDYTTKGLARICQDGVDSICATVRELRMRDTACQPHGERRAQLLHDLLTELSCILHVSTDYLLMGSEPSKEEVKNDLLSIISELSTIAKKI